MFMFTSLQDELHETKEALQTSETNIKLAMQRYINQSSDNLNLKKIVHQLKKELLTAKEKITWMDDEIKRLKVDEEAQKTYNKRLEKEQDEKVSKVRENRIFYLFNQHSRTLRPCCKLLSKKSSVHKTVYYSSLNTGFIDTCQ